jgi:transcriptional regulator with XRE-family HTH domain
VDRSEFAERMARLRRAAGMTQEQWADELSVSRARIAAWENDNSFIRHPEILKIRTKYNVDADFILFGDTNGLTNPIISWLRIQNVID